MSELWERVGRFVRDWWGSQQTAGADRRRHDEEVERTIERVVDHANPRIRGLPGYRRRLRDAVARSLDYCDELAQRLPGPVRLDRQTWSSDPQVNALFASADRMRWALTSPQVRAYVKETPLETGDCYAVLAAMPQVRSQLGMELLGDAIQRDVKQTTVSFANHEVGLPAGDPEQVRVLTAHAVMDTLVGTAVQDIAAQEERIAGLDERLRMVRIKQKALSPTARSVDLLGTGGEPKSAEYEALGKRIQELEMDLADARQGLSTLDDYLDRLVAVLRHPENHVGARLERVRLDRMNVVRQDRGDDDAQVLEFLRGYRGDRPGRVLLMVRFPRSELVPDSERLAEVERYVNA